MGKGGEILVLDMGEPVRIVDLARDMIRLSGADPDQIPIVFTGLRPGEKLYEEPLASEEATKADAASEAAHRAGARGEPRRGRTRWSRGASATARRGDAEVRAWLQPGFRNTRRRPARRSSRSRRAIGRDEGAGAAAGAAAALGVEFAPAQVSITRPPARVRSARALVAGLAPCRAGVVAARTACARRVP